jgi:predicted Zn finger-like uncharacterized protein
MNVSCPDCRSVFRVDPAKVPPGGVRARCSVCSGIISIPAPTGTNTPPGGSPRTMSGSEIAAPPPPRPRSNPEPQGAWDSPPFSIPTAPRPAAPPAPPTPAPTVAPPFVPSARSGSASTAAPPTAPAAPRATAPAPSASAVSTATPPGARRPLNPFLSKDPNQRAQRLARALVSDIITYHPAKHAEGLRDGTLKQLFREEIKKSFEEYIAQVGQQLAESTTYFQEALNEVLGGGKKIF